MFHAEVDESLFLDDASGGETALLLGKVSQFKRAQVPLAFVRYIRADIEGRTCVDTPAVADEDG